MIRIERSSGVVLAIAVAAGTLACSSADDGEANPPAAGGIPGAPGGAGGTVPGATGGAAGAVPGATGGAAGAVPGGSGGTVPGGSGGGGAGGGGAGGTAAGGGGAGGAGTGGAGTGGAGTAGSPNIGPDGKLIPPAAGKGVQMSTKLFRVNPGQELFRCFHAEVPSDGVGGEIDVARFESLMSHGSHHFILYRADTDTTPSGTLTNSACTLGFDQRWTYTSGSPHNYLDMPKGVAMVLAPRQKVVFDMHYINTTDEPIDAQVTLNINFAEGEFQKAAALVSFNTEIAIPANGKQTVEGDCTPPPGAKFFLMSTHTHRRGVLATITRKSPAGQLVGEPIVKTTDWEHPAAGLWMNEPFLTFAPGETFNYSCSFVNDRNSVTRVGSSADINEMCMAVTYYFPAATGGRCN